MPIISKIIAAIFNWTAITPQTPIKLDIAVIILTFLPNNSPIASAMESLPKNSAILGAKIKPIINMYKGAPNPDDHM